MSKLKSKKTGIGKNPALVVVDLAKGFIDPDSPLAFPCDELISQNNKLIDEFRKKSIPIIFTTTIYKDQFEASVFREKLPDLNILNPESIKSITVLKNANDIAIYGFRGSGGVILIKTK